MLKDMEKRPLILGVLSGLILVIAIYRQWGTEEGLLTMLVGAGGTFLAHDQAAWVQLLWAGPSGFIAGFLGSDRATYGFKYGFVSGVLTLAIGITGAFLGQIWYFLSLLGGIIAGGGMEILYALGQALLISGVAFVLATFIVTVLSLAFGLFGAVGAGPNRTLLA